MSSLASLRGGQRLRIAAEAVEEERARPARVLDRGSLAPGRGLLDGGVDQPGRLGLAAPKAGEHEGAVRRDVGARGLGDAVGLGDQHRHLPEVSAQRHGLAEHVDAHRQHGQRAGLASELDPARGDREAGLVVPHHHRCRGREPPPAEDLLGRDIVARKGGRRPLEDRRRRGASVGERQRKALQQQIGRTAIRGGPRGRQSLARDLVQAGGAREPPGEQRRAPRVEIRLARELRIERLEGLRGAKEQAPEPRSRGSRSRRPRRAAGPGGRAGARPAAPTSAVASSPQCRIERASPQAGLGGGERPVDAARGIAGQRDRPLQKRRRGGEPAARLRPAGGTLQLQGDLPRRGPPRRRPDARRDDPDRRLDP